MEGSSVFVSPAALQQGLREAKPSKEADELGTWFYVAPAERETPGRVLTESPRSVSRHDVVVAIADAVIRSSIKQDPRAIRHIAELVDSLFATAKALAERGQVPTSLKGSPGSGRPSGRAFPEQEPNSPRRTGVAFASPRAVSEPPSPGHPATGNEDVTMSHGSKASRGGLEVAAGMGVGVGYYGLEGEAAASRRGPKSDQLTGHAPLDRAFGQLGVAASSGHLVGHARQASSRLRDHGGAVTTATSLLARESVRGAAVTAARSGRTAAAPFPRLADEAPGASASPAFGSRAARGARGPSGHAGLPRGHERGHQADAAERGLTLSAADAGLIGSLAVSSEDLFVQRRQRAILRLLSRYVRPSAASAAATASTELADEAVLGKEAFPASLLSAALRTSVLPQAAREAVMALLQGANAQHGQVSQRIAVGGSTLQSMRPAEHFAVYAQIPGGGQLAPVGPEAQARPGSGKVRAGETAARAKPTAPGSRRPVARSPRPGSGAAVPRAALKLRAGRSAATGLRAEASPLRATNGHAAGTTTEPSSVGTVAARSETLASLRAKAGRRASIRAPWAEILSGVESRAALNRQGLAGGIVLAGDLASPAASRASHNRPTSLADGGSTRRAPSAARGPTGTEEAGELGQARAQQSMARSVHLGAPQAAAAKVGVFRGELRLPEVELPAGRSAHPVGEAADVFRCRLRREIDGERERVRNRRRVEERVALEGALVEGEHEQAWHRRRPRPEQATRGPPSSRDTAGPSSLDSEKRDAMALSAVIAPTDRDAKSAVMHADWVSRIGRRAEDSLVAHLPSTTAAGASQTVVPTSVDGRLVDLWRATGDGLRSRATSLLSSRVKRRSSLVSALRTIIQGNIRRPHAAVSPRSAGASGIVVSGAGAAEKLSDEEGKAPPPPRDPKDAASLWWGERMAERIAQAEASVALRQPHRSQNVARTTMAEAAAAGGDTTSVPSWSQVPPAAPRGAHPAPHRPGALVDAVVGPQAAPSDDLELKAWARSLTFRSPIDASARVPGRWQWNSGKGAVPDPLAVPPSVLPRAVEEIQARAHSARGNSRVV